MTTTTERRDAFRFFCEHAGYVVGRRAEGALQLARAEALLAEAVDLELASVEWEADDLPWDEGTEISAEEASERFASGEWTGPFYCRVMVGDDELGDDVRSLGGIVLGSAGTGDPYARVVEAELASELVDELRQAIGDELDADLGDPFALTLQARLTRRAMSAAQNRGHDLGEWGPGSEWDPDASRADCRRCGMSVFVDVSPAPNGIDVSGEAVALDCTDDR